MTDNGKQQYVSNRDVYTCNVRSRLEIENCEMDEDMIVENKDIRIDS